MRQLRKNQFVARTSWKRQFAGFGKVVFFFSVFSSHVFSWLVQVDLTDALVILTGQSTFRIELARLNSAARKKPLGNRIGLRAIAIRFTRSLLQTECGHT